MSVRLRISILLLLLIIEAMLLWSLRWRGWFETGATLNWLLAAVIAVIPLVIGGIFLLYGGRRVSLRTLMICVACIASFIAIVMLPLLSAQEKRQATVKLLNSGARLDMSTLGHARIAHRGDDTGIPQWLHPIAGRLIETPMDCDIRWITISTDEQMSILLANTSRFTRVEGVLLRGPQLHSTSVINFSDSMPNFPRLEHVHFDNVAIPGGNCLSKMTGVKYLLMIGPETRPGYKRTNIQLESIGRLPSLMSLHIVHYDITDDDLSLFAPSETLKSVRLFGSDVTKAGVEKFRSTHPECTLNLK